MFHGEHWRATVPLLVLLVLPATSATAASLDEAFREAVQAHQVQENAVLLALRIAGAAWIAVEWVAAVALGIGFHQLRAVARKRGLLP